MLATPASWSRRTLYLSGRIDSTSVTETSFCQSQLLVRDLVLDPQVREFILQSLDFNPKVFPLLFSMLDLFL